MQNNVRRSSKSALATFGHGASAQNTSRDDSTNKDKQNQSIEYFSMGVKQLDKSQSALRKMKTEAESR